MKEIFCCHQYIVSTYILAYTLYHQKYEDIIEITLDIRIRKKRSGRTLQDSDVAWLSPQQTNYIVQCRSKVWKTSISITCISSLENEIWIWFTRKEGGVIFLWNILQATWAWNYILLDKSHLEACIFDTIQEKWCCSYSKEKRIQYLNWIFNITPSQ